jgi:hypothetical protein
VSESTGPALLFTGHMVDAVGRAVPRFPADQTWLAADAIRAELRTLLDRHPAPAPVISGAACGGDIIFQECCLELGLGTEICLALPPEEFRVRSVSFAGADWDERYDRLLARVPTRVLDPGPDGTVWQQCDEWMLERATPAEAGADRVVLLALWDGRDPGAGGGTGHMVDLVRGTEGEVRVIDTGTVFDLD